MKKIKKFVIKNQKVFDWLFMLFFILFIYVYLKHYGLIDLLFIAFMLHVFTKVYLRIINPMFKRLGGKNEQKKNK